MLGYPNELAVPIMPNFGAPPAPLGMLHVKVRLGRSGGRVLGLGEGAGPGGHAARQGCLQAARAGMGLRWERWEPCGRVHTEAHRAGSLAVSVKG